MCSDCRQGFGICANLAVPIRTIKESHGTQPETPGNMLVTFWRTE